MHVNENATGSPGQGGPDEAPEQEDALVEAQVEQVEPTAAPVPDVNELEDRLRDLQGAMEHLQTGDLDGAERAIEALEERMESTRD